MKISKITHIASDGKPWESQYGTMYPQAVSFEDGTSGQTNTKTEVPRWKVGDVVGYEISGKTPKGAPKLKIDVQAGQGGSGHTQHTPEPLKSSTGQSVPVTEVPSIHPAPHPINGQTVGMAVKAALDLTVQGPLTPDKPEFWAQVKLTASNIIRVSHALEGGHLSPAPWGKPDKPHPELPKYHPKNDPVEPECPF